LFLNIHLHCLVLDGGYRTIEGVPVFHAVRAPTAGEPQPVLNPIIKRLIEFLTRTRLLIEERGTRYLANNAQAEDRLDGSRAQQYYAS
jgi:hypothetical protein